MLRQQSKKLLFIGSNAFYSLIRLLTPYENWWLTAISSHCLAALPVTDVCVQQPHATKRLLPDPVPPDGCSGIPRVSRARESSILAPPPSPFMAV